MKGYFVLVPFPFTDLTASKIRPALVLVHEGKEDVVVAFISSRVPGGAVPFGSVLVEQSDPEFKSSGLKTSSIIRLDKVATLLSSLIIGELGTAGPNLCSTINRTIDDLYHL